MRCRPQLLTLPLALTSVACTTDDGSSDDVITSAAADETSGGSCEDPEVFSGDATWYELAGNPVNCGYPTDSLPAHYAALNGLRFDVGRRASPGACR